MSGLKPPTLPTVISSQKNSTVIISHDEVIIMDSSHRLWRYRNKLQRMVWHFHVEYWVGAGPRYIWMLNKNEHKPSVKIEMDRKGQLLTYQDGHGNYWTSQWDVEFIFKDSYGHLIHLYELIRNYAAGMLNEEHKKQQKNHLI